MASPLRPRKVWDDLAVWPAATSGITWDFRAGLSDVRLFPFESWRRIMAGRLRRSALGDPATAGDPAGLAELREAIARHVGVSRSVRASAADVVVTSGIQQALDLVVRVLLEPGDVVAVRIPGCRRCCCYCVRRGCGCTACRWTRRAYGWTPSRMTRAPST